MSADNYLMVREDATVWQGFMSDEEAPWVYAARPMHSEVSIPAALAWAHDYCAENIVEYGVTLTERARALLDAPPVPTLPLDERMGEPLTAMVRAAQSVLSEQYQQPGDMADDLGCDPAVVDRFWSNTMNPIEALDVLRRVVVRHTDAKAPVEPFAAS